jgi:hypothetical protein
MLPAQFTQSGQGAKHACTATKVDATRMRILPSRLDTRSWAIAHDIPACKIMTNILPQRTTLPTADLSSVADFDCL